MKITNGITREIKEEIIMNKQIRYGVFETNSSSTHSLTMCSNEEFKKWSRGEVLYWGECDKFASREEIIAELKSMKYSWNGKLVYGNVDWDDEDDVCDVFNDERIKTYDEFFDDDYYYTYCRSHTTPGGEEVVVFGYYGYC